MTATVTLALSELRSLITKAARGAGLSWGLAEEAGWAAEWLAQRGMPAADWATVWLAARVDDATSPIELGASMADAFADGLPSKPTVLPDSLAAPGYLLPFLHRIAQAGLPVAIQSPLGQVAGVSCAGQVTFGPCWQAQSNGWWLSIADHAEGAHGRAKRPEVSGSVLECLEGIALWTTVPGSATSRRDAGSLNGDND